MRGDCECGHSRACGSAEHPGLNQGSFLIRSVSEMIRLGPWNKGQVGRGAHRTGGGKNRLGRSVLEMIHLGPGYIFLFSGEALRRKEPSRKIRLGPGWNLILRRGAHRVGGNKIRPFSKDPSRTMEFLILRKSAQEFLILRRGGISYSQERRSLGWRWKDPYWSEKSAAQRLPCQRASPADRLSGG